ncbi:ATP-binding cassette domain-containing protein [Pontibacter harenae]|uniref:ATP-binding cassette domain-containing protein n=1 Tax=Pontibacter harenae TaxID=2894083 RepID=UPI001E63638E|nr:ATP-binding cassette domain-containing protein [Pontibacter harenae]MCC9168600.1 ATP-binding cassette domain-containing protein [Pontibacter harenae]
MNFEVSEGQHWALVGDSGSGKTRLLHTIMGKYNIVQGHMQHHYVEDFLAEFPQQDVPFNYRHLIAEVPQKHNFRNLSNTTEFYYQQRYHASDSEDAPTVLSFLDAVEAPVGKALYWSKAKVTEAFKLEKLLHKELIKLSNGETKRLLFAAALLKNPRLLLLDNPLTGLDVKTRGELHELISEITASGITVIMATSPKEISPAITHVATLANGEIVKQEKRQDFMPAANVEENLLSPTIQEELLALLQPQNKATFNTVVGMQDITISYGSKLVLDKVNWHINQGDRWALLGHNGAGKTTLLSLINGDNPQSYSQNLILFDRKRGSGESIWDIKSKIGFVSPELYQYFPYASTCHEVVESGFYDTLGLLRQSEPIHAELALRWMNLLGIAQDANLPLRNASASNQRLCLLARALVKHPPLLILDEPCQGLDQQQQHNFRNLLDAICASSNTTLIYVTHYQEELPTCVDKVLRLEQGKVCV